MWPHPKSISFAMIFLSNDDEYSRTATMISQTALSETFTPERDVSLRTKGSISRAPGSLHDGNILSSARSPLRMLPTSSGTIELLQSVLESVISPPCAVHVPE